MLVERPRVPLGVHRHLEFFQLRVAPRVPLDHGPLDGFAEVLLEVLGEPTREIFELGRGKAQARVLVLPLLRQRRGVLAHLLEKSSHLRVVPGVHAFEALQGFGVALRSRTSRAILRGRRRGVFVSVGRWARHDGNGERSRGRATGGSEAKRKHARGVLARARSRGMRSRRGGCGARRRDAYLSRLGSALVHHCLVSTKG